MGRKTDDSGGIDCPGEFAPSPQHGLERFGGLVVGNQHDDRLAGSPRHEGDVESPRRGGQSRHTSSPRTQAQMPSYALKTGRVLQLREHLTDKRENHAFTV